MRLQSSRTQTRGKELEEQLVKLETRLKEEINNLRLAELEDHAQNLGDRDSTNQVLRFQRDLQLTGIFIMMCSSAITVSYQKQ
ncbi:hypothetical protein HRI_001373600 [Hibiscus trionum]|uniref:Uncharacterized protein n=1 Tax=Hibiscus trionum TaxID=183268 RepID=A0A9W7LUF5_HIBTR|nr:hypothetical protein HRI_001373600 [Hibiscus trionum]